MMFAGPGARLLRVVHREHGLLGQRGDPVGELDVRDRSEPFPAAIAGSITSEVHQAASCSAIRRVLVALDPEQSLDGDGPEPLGQLKLEERHDRHLVLAKAILGRRLGHADGLADDEQQLERDPGPVADLLERLVRQGGEPLVARRVEEVEREARRSGSPRPARREGSPASSSDRTISARRTSPGDKPIRPSGREDPEVDQSIEIAGLDPGSLGGLNACVLGHCASLLALPSRYR